MCFATARIQIRHAWKRSQVVECWHIRRYTADLASRIEILSATRRDAPSYIRKLLQPKQLDNALPLRVKSLPCTFSG